MRKVLGILVGVVAMFGSLTAASPASAETATFEYTGGVQSWTVPYGVTIATFNLYGAQGGDGGKGGWARATIPVTPNSQIEVRVGGYGGINNRGYNGGGYGGRGGGGGTDIRIGGSALSDRILVAAGGGGGGYSCLASGLPYLPSGGDGGGLVGGNGGDTGCTVSGTGATQSQGGISDAGGVLGRGVLGQGGDGGASGGGGGYYGGGGGPNGYLVYGPGGPGGGGSSYGPAGFQTSTGVRSGFGTANADYTVTETRNLQTSAIGPGDGYLTSSPAGINCGLEGSTEHDVCVYTFGEDQPVTVTANPSPGSVFDKWIFGPCMGSTIPTCSTVMNQVRTVSGQFQNGPRNLSLTKSGNGSGNVTSAPAGIECDQSCSSDDHDYVYGTNVTLTAAPTTGTNFTGWTGACSGTSTCSVTMDEIRDVGANFTLQKRTLTVSKFENGSGSVVSTPAGIDHLFENCSGCDSVQAEFDYGTEITLNASGTTGSDFTDWGGVCQPFDHDVPCTFTMDQNRYAEVEFELQKRTLNVTRTGTGTGTVTSTSGPIDCGPTCTADYDYGTEVTLDAVAGPNSQFAGWSGACSGTSTCTVTLDQVQDVGAAFPLEKRELSVTASGNGSGSISSNPSGINCVDSCDSEFDYGTEVTLTADPQVGSEFTGWSGACSGSSDCVVELDQARSVEAVFTLVKHEISIGKTGNGGGTVISDIAGIDCGTTCSSDFDYGTEVTLTAAPNGTSEFSGWSGGCVGTSPTCSVTVDQALAVTATFALQKRDLTVQTEGSGQGSVTVSPESLDRSFDYGTVVTLTANPASESTFTSWGGACAGTAITCTLTMDQARSVTATFAKKSPVVTVPVIKALKTKKKYKAKKPIKIRIRVSKASTVTFRIKSVGKPKRVRTFKRKLKAGPSKVRVPNKIRKKLKPGKYVISAVARDKDGRASKAKKTRFKQLR